ncbi:hypothetical protein Tco_1114555 [Tanacetum coccineum]|uniref:Uncharacterized protein n=1 Tax=Tanacetum coccineum TaxID=301880 RepID=A0ABQ5IXM2_9ASTR
MWETGSYKTHEDHKNLYEALEKSMDHDHSDQLQVYLAEARKKRQKRIDSPRTPSGSPLPPPPPPPPPAGAFGAPACTTSDTRYESATFTATQETSPSDNLINDDSIPDEQVHLSDDEDNGNDHIPKADMRKDWCNPLPKEERPATPKLAWTIPYSNVSDVENNWASVLVSTYEPPTENSLLAKTGDMMTFMNYSILRDMILRHKEEKSENTCGFSMSSESKPIQDMEHPSDTYVFTMKMEILLEPTSNKLMVGDSDVHILEDLTLILEILSRRLFLRLNIPDHRLWFHWISFDYRVPLGFGSIAGSLDHVNPVIRLPIEHGISRGTRVIRLVLGIVGINYYDLVALPWMATPFANPERQFRARRDTSPAPIHNIYSSYEFESSKSEYEDVGEIHIETLTLEQYLALNLNNTRRRISNPEDATFEIKGQF